MTWLHAAIQLCRLGYRAWLKGYYAQRRRDRLLRAYAREREAILDRLYLEANDDWNWRAQENLRRFYRSAPHKQFWQPPPESRRPLR
jgi:hypothetical protein